MRALVRNLRFLLRDATAATAIEYGLILAMIVLAIMASLVLLGTTTTDIWNNVTTTVLSVTPS